MAASLGLEVASGNDALASHSDTRKSAKLMLQFLPGTDFVTSGYSVMPREDNLFGGGNFEAKDLDVWTLLQRDFQIDAGITPVPETEILSVRERAARAVQAVYQGLGLPPISDEEVHSAVTALNSDDLPSRSQAADVAGANRFFKSTATVLDVARILQNENFHREAQALMALTRQRAAGDYLQPAAILTPTEGDLQAESAFNTPHFYSGPGTGYRVEGARWDQLKEVPFARRPQDLVQPTSNNPVLRAVRTTKPKSGAEVVVGLSPAFGHPVSETLSGLSHQDVLKEIQKGIEQEGGATRLIHVLDTADCAFIGHQAAQLSGSGIAIGLQSRGTAVIHRHDLAPLDNLELLSQAPNLTLESYRALGRNAARYARGFKTEPIPVKIDNTSRLRHIVQTTLLHRIEVSATVPGAKPVEVELEDEEVGSDSRESKLRPEL